MAIALRRASLRAHARLLSVVINKLNRFHNFTWKQRRRLREADEELTRNFSLKNKSIIGCQSGAKINFGWSNNYFSGAHGLNWRFNQTLKRIFMKHSARKKTLLRLEQKKQRTFFCETENHSHLISNFLFLNPWKRFSLWSSFRT